jgi:hypothetical protein
MNFNSVNAVSPTISGAPVMDGNAVIDLAEVRAARGRIAVAAPVRLPKTCSKGWNVKPQWLAPQPN